MQSFWAQLAKNTSEETMSAYKTAIQDIITGRVSCLDPVLPKLSDEMLKVHDKLYTAICQASGAFPYKNHEGTRLISRFCLADRTQIGAQIILECLHRKIYAFDVLQQSYVCELIAEFVRTGLKDMLEEALARLTQGQSSIGLEHLEGTLVDRLLK